MINNKRKGKTEVDPFWNVEDIKKMMEYFEDKEMWHWYTVFNLGILLGIMGTVFIFFCLIYFTKDSILQVHAYHCKRQNLILFYG